MYKSGALMAFALVTLGVDGLADSNGQVLLGTLTWLVLLAACRGLEPSDR